MATKKRKGIIPDPNNLRLHGSESKSAIRASLEEVGPFRSIAIDGEDIVRAGNGVFEQAQEMGLKVTIVDAEPNELIAVRRKDLKGEAAERAALWDNQAQSKSTWEYGRLAEIAQTDKKRLEGIFSDNELLAFVRRQEAEVRANSRTDEDSEAKAVHDAYLDELQEKWEVREGDLYRLGEGARLLCGDCTKDLPRLLEGQAVNGIFTSPPYAEQRSQFYGGPKVGEYVDWFDTIQLVLKGVLARDGSFFLNIKEHCDKGQRVLYVKKLTIAMVEQWGWKLIDELVYEKTATPGDFKTRFKNAWEPVFHFSQTVNPVIYKKQVANISDSAFKGPGGLYKGSGHGAFLGGDSVTEQGLALPSNIVKSHFGGQSTGHSAAFPLSLPKFFILAFSQRNDSWLDPFSGSGTTILAAEKEGRKGYGIEREPRYVALTLERFEKEGYAIRKE